MAVRQLAQSLQRLTLQAAMPRSGVTPSLVAASGSGVASSLTRTQQSLANMLPLYTNIINRCGLHTSTVCLRNLDSHRVPKFLGPSNKNHRWEPRKKFSEMYEYTTKPLPFPKTGGRGPNGRIWNHRRAGGRKRRFRMIDWVRGGPTSGEPLVEKVDKIMYDPNRSARIALVISGEKKRYIIATQNMKAGDLIKSSRKLSATAVRAGEGDSYPVGSLPLGTLVNCVEPTPGQGALFARSAGVTATLLRKVDNKCILRLPSKQEISIPSNCVATVGRVSNEDHNKRVIGKAGRNRWFGIRPRSGRWHRKDGRFGRKIKPPKKLRVYDEPLAPKPKVYKMTF